MESLCVFCGSSRGRSAVFERAARDLGETIARSGRRLVYGGAHVGLMGVLADSALEAGGEVVGVIPNALVEREIAHTSLSGLHVVGSMHERKAKMAALSDGFIALPGGCGTLEEFFEVLTWAQLGEHEKPCGLLNVAGYYDGLLSFLDHAVRQGFSKDEHRRMVLLGTEPEQLLEAFESYQPPGVIKWVDRTET